MKSYGRTSVSGFLGDRIVYRDLQPYDETLPRFEEICAKYSINQNPVPRKHQLDYAHFIFHMLQTCQEQDQPDGHIERLVFIGDTRLLDGTAFANLCQVSGLPGLAFIASEDSKPASIQLAPDGGKQPVYLSNRWALLHEFEKICVSQGQPIGVGTAVVVDLDKTAVGGRGRNGQVIDQARMEAVEQTVANSLEGEFDRLEFRKIYDPLNQPEFHHFTADNQDYLAYICLILESGLVSFENLIQRLREGELTSFVQFITEIEGHRKDLLPRLESLHSEIFHYVQLGDPTPFKPFRRNEYLITVGKFGCLEDMVPAERMLADEIVITQEVRQMAKTWREQGALLFGLSDKPPEASLPTPEQAREGFLPLHQTITHAVGE